MSHTAEDYPMGNEAAYPAPGHHTTPAERTEQALRQEIALLENQSRRQCDAVRKLRAALHHMTEYAQANDPGNPHTQQALEALRETICS